MKKYLGDINKKTVHDLVNQKNNCKIDQITPDHQKYFFPDTYVQAFSEGYDWCVWCIGDLHE